MTRKRMLFPILLLAGSLSAGELPLPVFESTFRTDEKGQVLDNTPNPVKGNLTAGAKIVETPFGKGLELEGVLNNGVIFQNAPKLLLPEEFTVSGWVCRAGLPGPGAEKPYRVYTFFHRGENLRIFVGDNVGTEFSADGELFKLVTPKNTVAGNAWTHIAYVYSVSEGKTLLYINGVKQVERTKSVLKKHLSPFPIPLDQPLQFGSLSHYFPMKGQIGRPRVYGQALNAEQIIGSEQDMVRPLLAALRKELAAYPGAESLCAKIDSDLAEKGKVIPLTVLSGLYAERDRMSKVDTLRKSGKAADGNLVYCVVDPLGPDIFYRDTDLPESGINQKIRIAAAQNEYEPASFVVKPVRNIPNFLPVAEELKSADGHTIPASAIDIRLVKQIIVKGRTLSPNVLIHDDALLKVDPVKMEMSLRLNFPSGVKYLNVTPASPDAVKKENQTAKNFPVHDSPGLLPFDLQEGVNQQFWLTLKTTPEMKPGLYTSKISLTENGKMLSSIPVKVRILPFTLPEPKTNYDPSRMFTTSVYFFDDLSSGCAGSEDGAINHVMPLSRQQFQAYLNNLYEHGVRQPTIIMGNWYPSWNSWVTPQAPRVYKNPEKAKQKMTERLQMLKEAGFPIKPLYFHTGGNIGFREFYDRARHKELLEKFIAEGNAFYKKQLGHDDIYHYGLDEADGERLLKEFDVWKDMRAKGAKVYTTLKAANIPLVAGKLDVAVAVHKPEKANARLMHDNGGRLWVYAQPFATQVSGYAHRRGYGYGVYFADYDGICNYSFNHWDWRTIPWSMHNDAAPALTYTMPTADGVVDTPGWEGYREGIDDVRYATKLREEIARAASDPAKKKLAEKASRFLDTTNIDTQEFDSARTRMRIIDYILDLTEK